MIDGQIVETHVFPEAGMPGWCWWVKVERQNGAAEFWTPLATYRTEGSAQGALTKWRKSRTERGMVQMDPSGSRRPQ